MQKKQYMILREELELYIKLNDNNYSKKSS